MKKKEKMLGASHHHNFPQDGFAWNDKLWHTTRSVEKKLFRKSEEGGRWMVNGRGRACRKKKVGGKESKRSFPFLIMTHIISSRT